METKFTPEFIREQREIIANATKGKWAVGYTADGDMEWETGSHAVGGLTGEDVYDRDMGVYVVAACDQDDHTEYIPETIVTPWVESDAVHIAEAHNNYPAALDRIAELEATNADLREELARAAEVERGLHETVARLRYEVDLCKRIIDSGERVVNDAANQAEARLRAEAELEKTQERLEQAAKVIAALNGEKL